MQIIKPFLALSLTVVLTLLAGYSSKNSEYPGSLSTAFSETSGVVAPQAPETSLLNAISPSPSVLPLAARTAKGNGDISYENADETLTDEQEQLLLHYMNLFYESLAALSAEDPSALFAAHAQDQALTRQSAWQIIIDVRRAQQLDLSLTAFSYELHCIGIDASGDGDVSVMMRENAVQNFTAFPGVDSESHNVYHRFTMADTDAGWKLSSHMQMDSANMVALGRAMFRGWRADGEGNADIDIAELAAQRESVLSAHTVAIVERMRQAAAYNLDAPPVQSWMHDYDRAAAVTYAMQWVETRNSDSWPSYDRYGGNCANYTSQCLLAGGIPMDYFGTSQWKWYGDTPNTSQTAAGRSGAWSGVNEFYTYVTSNTGYGMVTEPDANYWSGEPGDLIQLGYEDNWRHVVIITDVIKDAAGNTVDYLISSNTADQRSYPVSAYLYPQQRLIKIYGWNEGQEGSRPPS